MASTSKRRTSKPSSRERAVSKTVAPAAGPVTLAEAQALAMAKRAKSAKRVLRKSAAAPASPATVGKARELLQKERNDEIARRVDAYKATMAIMKKRGARRPQPKGAIRPKKGEPAPKGESFAPLQILAEGDSWFDYPVPFFGGGIIPRLERKLGVPILNLAQAGDEVRYMLGVEQRKLLAKHLTRGCPAGGPWDVLLFSGGGNDIVGDPMALWIRSWNSSASPGAHIQQARFDSALALVRAGYEDLISMRDALSPGTHLVFHGYDFALPDGRGICHLGPWLKPTFDLHGFPSLQERFEVVKVMLQQFAALLTQLTTYPKVTFVNGQATLPPQKKSWHNELHPACHGFEAFADIFYHRLKALYPDRIA